MAEMYEQEAFKCCKCKYIYEYSEFAAPPDPNNDYGYYIIEGYGSPVGIQIIEEVDLCIMCAKVIVP